MTAVDVLRGVRKLGPITAQELIDALGGGSYGSASNALRAGIDRGLLRKAAVWRRRHRVFVYSVTTLGNADCECGRPKEIDLEACDRCLYLDGTDRRALIIEALRGTDGMSIFEICVALGMNTAVNNGRRDTLRYIQLLMAEGRLRRYWRDDSAGVVPQWSHRKGAGERHTARGCWAYQLDGKTDREWIRRAA